ncbi:hypothetical protein CDIK_0829 [Cucumispora dikerogammari]|nr:hypothetical protein CDIK_0829 [Cucumispora dikerogammari]
MLIYTLLTIYSSELSESEFLYRKMPSDLQPPPLPTEYTPDQINAELKLQEDLLNSYLGLKKHSIKIPSFKYRDIFDRFLHHVSLNPDDFFINGGLGIDFQIRYLACCFIVVFIPGQIAFFFPAKAFDWIPKRLKKLPFLRDFLRETKRFLKFIKKESKDKLFITATFGRSKGLFDDLKACVYAVRDFFDDTEKSIKTILDFEIRAENYDVFKETDNKKSIEIT